MDKISAPWRNLRQWGARFASVRWRLTLWYVGMLTAALFVFGGIVYGWQAAKIQTQLRNDIAFLQQQAGQFSVVSSALPASGAVTMVDFDGASTTIVADTVGGASVVGMASMPGAADVHPIERGQHIVADGVDGSPVAGVAPVPGSMDITLVVGPQGQIMQRSGPIGGGDLQRILDRAPPAAVGPNGLAFPMTGVGGTARLPADYQFYAQHILVGDGGPGTLILGRPSAAVGELNRLMATLLGAGVVTLLVVGAGGYWLATRSLRPVQAVTHAAREISETDLSRRLNLPNRDELGELAATFDTMLSRLDEAFRRQRQFTNDASHELRTPLTVVELEIDRAMAHPGLPSEHMEALATIRSESAYMARLVSDLLTLARAETGQAPLNQMPLDASDLVLEVVERLLPLARQQGIEIDVGDLPPLLLVGDRLLLIQMLSNLVENAVKYSAGHGRRVIVDAGRYGTGPAGRAWVRVADSGPGIPAEHLPHLFDRFYRVDQMRTDRDTDDLDGAPRGSGLGLSIVRWVARAHGGDVRVESKVGRGSVFEVWLPLYSGR